jgi:hypothetical protein
MTDGEVVLQEQSLPSLKETVLQLATRAIAETLGSQGSHNNVKRASVSLFRAHHI